MALDVQKWLNDNMQALNLSDEEKALATKLSSGEFGKRLGASIYPQEAVSGLQSALDKRDAEKKQLEEANVAWQEQYWKDLSELGALDRLQAAGFDTTGLTAKPGGGVTTQHGQTLTADQINKMIEDKAREIAFGTMDPMRKLNLDYSDFLVTAAPEYYDLTGKRLDAKKFREFAAEHAKEYATLPQAFEAFTSDARKAKQEADQKKWEADKEKEIELRVMSRMQIPEVSPESGVGGPFDIASKAPAAASGDQQSSNAPSREVNRQEFAKKYRDL